jgi:hypothetical protein
VGGLDIGALSMHTARADDSPLENLSTIRMKKQVLNPNSFLGVMGTSRISGTTNRNAALGVDATINVTGDEYLQMAWAQTFDTNDPSESGLLDRNRARIQWERVRQAGLSYGAGLSRAGADYLPGLGFQWRHDFTQLNGKVGHGWLPEAPFPISTHRLILEGDLYYRNGDGSLESAEVALDYALTTRGGHEFMAFGRFHQEDLLEPFALSQTAGVAAGTYRYSRFQGEYDMPAGRLFRTAVRLGGGSFFDGRQFSAGLAPLWSISPRMEIGGSYQFESIRFDDRNERFDAHLVRFRGNLMFSTQFTVSTFVQYNSAADAIVANVRFRFNPREGTDLFLVYNEGLVTDRRSLTPIPPLSTSRTVIAKYTYTFSR